jgi:hypothetical protein
LGRHFGCLDFILAANNIQIPKKPPRPPYNRLILRFSPRLDALSANAKAKRQLYFRGPRRIEKVSNFGADWTISGEGFAQNGCSSPWRWVKNTKNLHRNWLLDKTVIIRATKAGKVQALAY